MQTISWNDIAEQRINENITRKMFWGENIMVTRWELAPNTALPVHEHVSEQVTMVQEGSVTLVFPGEEKVTLRSGDMLVIPPSKPHGVEVGPQATALLWTCFHPCDRILSTAGSLFVASRWQQRERSRPLPIGHGLFAGIWYKGHAGGIEEHPLGFVRPPVPERDQCITMGQLRQVLGMDKTQAKALLREWKHGDDHSEASYRKMMERMIMLPSELKQMTPTNPRTSEKKVEHGRREDHQNQTGGQGTSNWSPATINPLRTRWFGGA